MSASIENLCTELLAVCARRNLKITTAESCTGGWVAKAITDLSGSSAIFDRGFVTYSNEAKMDLLGISPETLDIHGAVSEQTVLEMASGALANSKAQLSAAISGIAGPGGGTAEKPVGTVWFAWSGRNLHTQAVQHHLEGDRNAVRRQSVEIALQGLINRAVKLSCLPADNQ